MGKGMTSTFPYLFYFSFLCSNILSAPANSVFVSQLIRYARACSELCAVQKLLTFFSAKNIRMLCIESAKTVNEMILNELIKLTTL